MNLIQLEAQRKAAAKAQGVRYYKLTKRQAMEMLCKINTVKRQGSPFPANKEAV